MENKEEKILTISVAAYNLGDMIRTNLESFCNSSIINDIEVIVTDDESKDNTAQIVEEFVEKYPNSVKLIKQKNSGPGSTVNSGIKNATGKYFKMVDGDDWVETENLETFINYLKNTDADIVLTNYEIYSDKEKKIIEKNKLELEENKEAKFEDVCKNLKLDMHHTTIKTEILQKNNIILDNGFYTDVEYLLLPMEFAKTVVYYNLDIYIYRIARAGQSVSIPSMQKNIEMHDLVLKRLIKFYENNSKLGNNTKDYLSNRISIMADTQLGILLTFEPRKEIKDKIKEFNKYLRDASTDIYNKYKKSKKSRLLLYSKYSLYPLISKLYLNKLNAE